MFHLFLPFFFRFVFHVFGWVSNSLLKPVMLAKLLSNIYCLQTNTNNQRAFDLSHCQAGMKRDWSSQGKVKKEDDTDEEAIVLRKRVREWKPVSWLWCEHDSCVLFSVDSRPTDRSDHPTDGCCSSRSCKSCCSLDPIHIPCQSECIHSDDFDERSGKVYS